MILYHFTSAAHLHGISKFRLPVGDVVTDIGAFRGKVGVWLTTSQHPKGMDWKAAESTSPSSG